MEYKFGEQFSLEFEIKIKNFLSTKLQEYVLDESTPSLQSIVDILLLNDNDLVAEILTYEKANQR